MAGSIILFTIACLLAFAFLVGTVTSSTAVSIMATFALFFFSAILNMHKQIEAAMSSEWAATAVKALYWILPKTAQLGQSVVALVAGDEGPRELASALTLTPFLTTAAFGVASLALASLLFSRKDF
jgi:hypothetical protein